MACGIAGLSHAADSLSAIKYAKVRPVRDERGLMVDFKVDGEFPYYGNNDDRADDIAKMLVSMMMNKIRNYPTYRGAKHTQSVLTITANVVYGKGTGNTPDGRRKGEPFAPGANPSNGRDSHGALAACQIQKFLGKAEIDIQTRPIVSCRKVRKRGSFARAGRPYRQNQLVISVLCLGQNVLDLRTKRGCHVKVVPREVV